MVQHEGGVLCIVISTELRVHCEESSAHKARRGDTAHSTPAAKSDMDLSMWLL